MPKAKPQIIKLADVVLFVLCVCGGSGGCHSAPGLNLSGQWSFTTSTGTVGTLALTQHGGVWWLGRIYRARITGTLAAPNYHGLGFPVSPGKENASIEGTLFGSSLQGTIAAWYGPIACGGEGSGLLSSSIGIGLTGTVASNGNSMAGQFVTHKPKIWNVKPASCFGPGDSGNWSASRM